VFSVYYRLILKFDTYRNLQRHHAGLPAIARLSSNFLYRAGYPKSNTTEIAPSSRYWFVFVFCFWAIARITTEDKLVNLSIATIFTSENCVVYID